MSTSWVFFFKLLKYTSLKDIQFTIDDQLLLYRLLMEIRAKAKSIFFFLKMLQNEQKFEKEIHVLVL